MRRTLPWIIDSAVRLHDVVPVEELPLLDRPGVVELTAEQTSVILSNMFLCTMNRQDSLEVDGDIHAFPHSTMWPMLTSSSRTAAEKLKCFIHYFDRLRLSRDTSWRSRKIYFRRTVSGDTDAGSAPQDPATSSLPMSRLIVSSRASCIKCVPSTILPWLGPMHFPMKSLCLPSQVRLKTTWERSMRILRILS